MPTSGQPVAVAGGTGVVGRHVVDVLAERGVPAVVLSRSHGVDLLAGAAPELSRVLDGVDAVVDCLNVATLRRDRAVDFFTRTSRLLVDAGRRAAVRHHVVLSIVGIDRVRTGYYAGKLQQEQVVRHSGVPATIVRATQFHEFAEQVLDRGAVGPVHLVPRIRVQPAAARQVAELLVDVALGPVLGTAPEIAGPAVHELPDLARDVLRARRRRGVVLGVRAPGQAGRAMAAGALLPEGEPRQTGTTFASWLAAQPGTATS